MDFQPFCRRCEEKFPKDNYAEVFVKKAEEVFADGRFSDNTRACELFYTTGKISKAQFFRVKKYVKELYEWLYDLHLVTKEQWEYVSSLSLDDVLSDEEIRNCYFRDLDSALDFICAVGRRCGLSHDDDLLTIKAIVIFSWYGVDRSDMSIVRKSGLVPEFNTVCISDKTSIVLPDKYFGILYRLSILDEHRGFPTGKLQVYEDSPYLMRASKSVQMDKGKISQAIKRFNVVTVDQFGHRLSTRALQSNGVFYKMLQSQEQDSRSLTEVVKEIVGCDKHAAFWYKVTYEKWKNIFYPDGGAL